MRILCTAKGFALTDGLESQVHQRIRLGLDRFAHLICSVQVLIRDENGPKGGLDKRCTVELELAKGGRIVCKSVSSDACAAIGEAFQRIERALSTFAKRQRGRRSASTITEMEY